MHTLQIAVFVLCSCACSICSSPCLLLSLQVEKIWAKRLQQWKTEKEARKKLMQDVLEMRKKQIDHKCELMSVAKKSVLQLLCE